MPRMTNRNGSVVNVPDDKVEQVRAVGFEIVKGDAVDKAAEKKRAAKKSSK